MTQSTQKFRSIYISGKQVPERDPQRLHKRKDSETNFSSDSDPDNAFGKSMSMCLASTITILSLKSKVRTILFPQSIWQGTFLDIFM